jgi:hypothetical protein
LEEKQWLMTRTRERQNYTSRLHTHTGLQRLIMARKTIRLAKSTRNRRFEHSAKAHQQSLEADKQSVYFATKQARRRAKPTESYFVAVTSLLQL